MRPNLTILCGPTCGGKTTLLRQMSRGGYFPIVTSTTRPIRDDEVDAVDYNFINEYEFEKQFMCGELTLVRTFRVISGAVVRYGVPVSELRPSHNKPRVMILDAQGVRDIKRLGHDPFVIFVTAPAHELVHRAVKRGDLYRETANRLDREDLKLQHLIADGMTDLHISTVSPEIDYSDEGKTIHMRNFLKDYPQSD